LRLEDFQCVQYFRSYTIEPRKHQAVNIAERQSLRGFTPQHVELVSKDQDLGFQRSPRAEQSDQGAPDQPAKIAHRERVSADSQVAVSRLGFAVGTTSWLGIAGPENIRAEPTWTAATSAATMSNASRISRNS